MSTSHSFVFASLGMMAAATGAPARAADGVVQTVPLSNGWNRSLFDYARPDKLAVEESTPSAAQVNWAGRPPQLPGGRAAGAVAGAEAAAAPRVVEAMNVVRLRFTDADGDVVPVLLCTPAGRAGPFPVVVAVHGLGSHKAQVAAQVAPALTKRGFAVLCPDLPRHGERPG
ncbi:MAG TPA: hypothetical protein VF796_02255, partial [Humisphaera sp.]